MKKGLLFLIFFTTLQGFSLVPVERKPMDMLKRLSLMVNARNTQKRETPPIAQLFNSIDVKQVRNITTVALLVGAVSVQHRMDKHMKRKLDDMNENLGKRSISQNKAVFEEIEKIMYRNTRSLLTLAKVIVTGSETIKMSNNMADSDRLKESTLGQLIDIVDQTSFNPSNTSLDHILDQGDVEKYSNDLNQRVNDHLDALKRITSLMTNEVVELFKPRRQSKKVVTEKPEELETPNPKKTATNPEKTVPGSDKNPTTNRPEKLVQQNKFPSNSLSFPLTPTAPSAFSSLKSTKPPALPPLSSFTDFPTVSAVDVYSQYINKLPTMIARPSLMRVDHHQLQQLQQLQHQHQPQQMPPALTTGFGVFYQIPLLFDTGMVSAADPTFFNHHAHFQMLTPETPTQEPQRRQDKDKEEKKKNSTEPKLEAQSGDPTVEIEFETQSEEESSEEVSGPGGLAGLIMSLSGGEDGSDVGALVGALSGVITNIFGPDGLDIESLLTTGTSLISGLLGGDENIGKTFANFLGAAIDGLSGGAADYNGLFFGNFLGGTLARLSADPEDDEAPIRPDIFIDNLAKGFNEGLGNQKAGGGDAEEDPHKDKGGSDSAGFLSKIIGSVVNLVVQIFVGSSGGSSEGSASLSGSSSSASQSSSGSSHPHKPHPHPDGYL